jgi:hypothetical protein
VVACPQSRENPVDFNERSNLPFIREPIRRPAIASQCRAWSSPTTRPIRREGRLRRPIGERSRV